MDLVNDSVAIFAEGRAGAIALGRSLRDEQAATPVPACPGWCVQDVFSHVTGIVDDFLAGRLDGVGSDAWTAAQVDPRRGRPFGAVLDEYEAIGPLFEALVAAQPDLGALPAMPLAMRLTADLTVHLGDVAQALGIEPDRTSRSVRLTLARYAPAFVDRVNAAGLAPVRIEALEAPSGQAQDSGAAAMTFGAGPGALTVRAPVFDLLRSLTGRRSLRQILALDWSGDASAHAPLCSAYGLPDADGI
ncbi:MAG: maleylpyruvate isomerase family mycothiol-dependent enzyme [Acidimicrobiia bacterium]|nr:maleylpyruvate isomerase family mycothiol-dependent enzyme [Acidimicrobiia bacterium]